MPANPFFNGDMNVPISPYKTLQYATLFDFPTIGNEGNLYIDKSQNRAYRWDDSELKYFCVGADWDDIEIIDGGDMNG